MGYTYDELLKMGATPTDTAPTQKKKYTYEELTAMGATPTQPTKPTQPAQPPQDITSGLALGFAKGAGSTLESGFRSGGQIVGGIGGRISVPIQERKQGDLTSQYEQLINMAKNASPIEKSSLLTKARKIQGQIQKAGQPSKQFAGTFDNPLLAKAREALQPKTTAEKVGYGAEKIGEFLATGNIGKQVAPKLAGSLSSYGDELLGATKFLPRVSGAMVKNIPQGFSTATTALAQEGVKDTSRAGATKAVGKSLLAGTTDVLLAGAMQSAKEVFGAGKKAL